MNYFWKLYVQPLAKRRDCNTRNMVTSEYQKNKLKIRKISYEFFVNFTGLIVLEFKLQKCEMNSTYDNVIYVSILHFVPIEFNSTKIIV